MQRGVVVMHVAFVGRCISRRSEVHYRLQSTKSPERLHAEVKWSFLDRSQVVSPVYLLFMRRFTLSPSHLFSLCYKFS